MGKIMAQFQGSSKAKGQGKGRGKRDGGGGGGGSDDGGVHPRVPPQSWKMTNNAKRAWDSARDDLTQWVHDQEISLLNKRPNEQSKFETAADQQTVSCSDQKAVHVQASRLGYQNCYFHNNWYYCTPWLQYPLMVRQKDWGLPSYWVRDRSSWKWQRGALDRPSSRITLELEHELETPWVQLSVLDWEIGSTGRLWWAPVTGPGQKSSPFLISLFTQEDMGSDDLNWFLEEDKWKKILRAITYYYYSAVSKRAWVRSGREGWYEEISVEKRQNVFASHSRYHSRVRRMFVSHFLNY